MGSRLRLRCVWEHQQIDEGGQPRHVLFTQFNLATNRFATIPGATPTYDANGNLTYDGFHSYGWDADGNLITVDGVTGIFDALDRRAELGSAGNNQTLYPPFALTHPIGLAASLSAAGIRIPMPGGGEVIYTSTGISNYRHPNWQGSQVLLSFPTQTTPTVGSAFTPFGEKYAIYSGGGNGYFAGMLGIADDGPIGDAYQAEARLMHQDEGRWVSPDPAGLGAVDLTNPQTLNRYAYVANDPLNNTDPGGTGNCEPPQYCQPNPSGDGGHCVSANPSTSSSFLGSCAQALAQTGSLPAGCPSAPPTSTSNGAVGSGNGFMKKFLPSKAKICFDNQNYFYAPPTFDIGKIEAAGKAGGLNPQAMNAAVGHYGAFDFQRTRDSAGNTTFYSGYTPVSNFAVGAYLYSAGFGRSVARFIANTFALFKSTNSGDPAQATYRNLGFDTAAMGQVPARRAR